VSKVASLRLKSENDQLELQRLKSELEKVYNPGSCEDLKVIQQQTNNISKELDKLLLITQKGFSGKASVPGPLKAVIVKTFLVRKGGYARLLKLSCGHTLIVKFKDWSPTWHEAGQVINCPECDKETGTNADNP